MLIGAYHCCHNSATQMRRNCEDENILPKPTDSASLKIQALSKRHTPRNRIITAVTYDNSLSYRFSLIESKLAEL